MNRSGPRIAKLRLARLLKPLLAAAIVVVVAMITVYFIVHLKRRPTIPPEKKEIAQQKVEIQEKVEFFDFKGNMQINADRRYLGEDNLYHLVGNVRIVDKGKKGGRDIRINGEAVTYDKDLKHFVMQGKISVRSKDLLLQTERFEYDRDAEILKTESGLVITSPRFSGSGARAVYSLKDDAMSLEKDVTFKIIPRFENPEPLVFEAGRLFYSLKDRNGKIESASDDSPIRIAHGKSRGVAREIDFEQFSKDDDLRVLYLRGRVKLSLEEKAVAPARAGAEEAKRRAVAEERRSEPKWNFLQSEKQEVEAEEIKIRSFLNTSELHAVESKGRCSFKFLSATGEQTLVHGEAVDFIFNRGEKLREFRVFTHAQIAGFGQDGGLVRSVEAETIILDGETKVMRIEGKEGALAHFATPANEASAEKIEAAIQDDSFLAEGKVTAVLRPQTETTQAPGFFSKDKPVFAAGRSMRYSAEEKRFLLSGKAKMWQDKVILTGGEISISEATQEMKGRGQILSVFPRRAKEGEKEGRAEISAETVAYDPKANQVVYEGGKERCSLKTKDVTLRAMVMTVFPGEQAGNVRSLRATKDVLIVQGTKEAVGETADYDVEKDTMVITGRPVLTDKNRGIVRGDKLTFRLADGTIQVENRDQERSVSVIKS